MPNRWRTYFIILAAAFGITLWLSIDGCNRERQSKRDAEALIGIHMRDSAELVEKTNRLGKMTVTAEAFQLSQKSLDRYVAENADLKNELANAYKHVSSVSQTVTEVRIDTIKVPMAAHDTIPCGDVDKSYPVQDRYYSFDFRFKNKAGREPEFYFLNVAIPDTAMEVIGVRKFGFLNMRRELVSEQTHTNKYIQVKGVKTIVKSEARPRTLKKVAIGVGIGILATMAAEAKIGNMSELHLP